jgi:sulfatase maturation enzyme AslB (radical SAM superfamily)
MQANSTLLNENVIQKIEKLNIKIGISFNGMEDWKLRAFHGEKNSAIDAMRGNVFIK